MVNVLYNTDKIIKDQTITGHYLWSGVVPIFPKTTAIKNIKVPEGTGFNTYNVSRYQLPIIPGYGFTDYRIQGYSLQNVVVDIADNNGNAASSYVMLSRSRMLEGLYLLRDFDPIVLNQQTDASVLQNRKRLEQLATSSSNRVKRFLGLI